MSKLKSSALTLCVVLWLLLPVSCADSQESDDVDIAEPTNEIAAVTATAHRDDSAEGDDPATPEPSPVPEIGADGVPFVIECEIELPPGPPLLESRILGTDVIVRARVTSSRPSYMIKDRVPGDRRLELLHGDTYRYTDPYPDDPDDPSKLYWYFPVRIFEFDVLEYLKGSGPSKLRMIDLSNYYRGALTSCGYQYLHFATKEEALSHAPGAPPRSENDAILFLDRVTPVEEHERTMFLRRDPDESTDDAADRPEYSGDQELGWFRSQLSQRIPAGERSDDQVFEIDVFENFRGADSPGRLYVPDPNGESGSPHAIDIVGEMNVAELRWWISQLNPIEAKARNEADHPDLSDCLSRTWYGQRMDNAYGGSPHTHDVVILSGLPAGNRAFGSPLDAEVLEQSVLRSNGQESAFFEVEDNPNDHPEYVVRINVKRPMPAGKYVLELAYQQQLCGITSEHYHKKFWNVEAVAPADVLHEAIFDPASSENGDHGYDHEGAGGYVDTALGNLDPQTFELPTDGRDFTVQRLVWNEGTIELQVRPHADLSDYDLGIIGLDGTTKLTLPFGSATVRNDGRNRIYVWEQCDQPWHSGDELMIRLRNTIFPKQYRGSAYPTPCQPSENLG